MDQLWQLREKAQKKVMEVGGDVSNGLLSVETKSRQTGGGSERGNGAPPSAHTYTYTHLETHTSHPEAADAVDGLLHDLDVFSGLPLSKCNRTGHE